MVDIAISDVVSILARERRWALERNIDQIDVRLCVNGEVWWLNFGDVCYDLEHAPICAAGMLLALDPIEELLKLARDLIDDAKDQAAEMGVV